MLSAAAAEPERQSRAEPDFSLARGALHEFYAHAEADAPSLSALALMLGSADGGRAKLWVRHEALTGEAGAPNPAGIAELGIDPAHLLLVRARDAPAALQAGLEGARCAALGAVIVEIRGEARAYDLTASRRLALAARASGVPVFLLRSGAKATPSAAETRWLARAAASRPLAAKAPGHPAFHLALLRARDGREGLRHHLEWSRDDRRLERRPPAGEAAGEAGDGAAAPVPPLSRLVVPLPADGPRPEREDGAPARRAG